MSSQRVVLARGKAGASNGNNADTACRGSTDYEAISSHRTTSIFSVSLQLKVPFWKSPPSRSRIVPRGLNICEREDSVVRTPHLCTSSLIRTSSALPSFEHARQLCILQEEGGFPSEIFTREARTFSEGKPPFECEHTPNFACANLCLFFFFFDKYLKIRIRKHTAKIGFTDVKIKTATHIR